MATDPPSSRSDEESTETPISTAGSPPARGLTRASAAWVATGAALLLLILLIVFILQNSTKVEGGLVPSMQHGWFMGSAVAAP